MPEAAQAESSWLSGPGLRRAAGLALSRGAGVAAQIGVQIAAGLVSGPAGIGLLQLYMAWSQLAGEIVNGGEATRALRDVSILSEAGERQRILRRLRQSAIRILIYSLLMISGITALLYLAPALLPEDGSFRMLLISILAAAPLVALARLFAESLKALSEALAAVTLENLLLPATLLLLCAAMGGSLIATSDANLLIGASAGLMITTLALGHRLAIRLQRLQAGAAMQSANKSGGGMHEQWFLWLNGPLNIAFLQLPFLLLPWLVDTTAIGGFAVAYKLVNIITTLLILIAAVYAPRFARAASKQDSRQLRQLLRETQLIALLAFTPTWALLLLSADSLGALFSLESGSLAPLLLVLGCGQLANAATGLSGVLLSMSGGAGREFRILLVSGLATILAAVMMRDSANLNDLATLIAAGIALRNGLSYVAAHAHLSHLVAAKP
jgi:O-antigen/teichoic acid export membrane protein